MGNFPQVGRLEQISIVLPTPAIWMDHRFLGQPVLPAVEAMEILAQTIRQRFARHPVSRIIQARFEKFLFLNPETEQSAARVELEALENGNLQAALLTRAKAPKAAITRTKVHARMTFAPPDSLPSLPGLETAVFLEGICTTIPPESIYADLVPFGQAFRNIKGPLLLSAEGALARIETPAQPADPGLQPLLGSSFALDAAFHAACVWAQRYHGIVAFPVAVEQRCVLAPARAGKTYFGRIFPKAIDSGLLRFDICLRDENGRMCEWVEGVQMRDVSAGRLQPPAWIISPHNPDPLQDLRSACPAMSIIELDGITSLADEMLTSLEKQKYRKMVGRRRKSFMAARLALKHLYCQIAGRHAVVPANQIETVYEDSALPRIGGIASKMGYHCSVSHDRRFAIAAADTDTLGVDVEVIGDKILNFKNIFMSKTERGLLRESILDQQQAATRIWSIKEAVAKARGMHLAEAWERVQVTALQAARSDFSLAREKMTARHAVVDDHLFTLVPSRNWSK